MTLTAEIVKTLLLPGSISALVVGLLLGVVLLYTPLTRWGRRWLVLLAFTYLVLATPAVAMRLPMGLGPVYPPIQTVEQARGAQVVVVLGNGVVTYTNGHETVPTLTRRTAFNVIEGVRLYRLLGQPRMILSGGVSVPGLQMQSEAEAMADRMVLMGVPRERMTLDPTSTNTYEQSVNVQKILGDGARLVVVTTAVHMPRTMDLFTSRGLQPVPSPSAIEYAPAHAGLLWQVVPNPASLWASQMTIYEYLAIANGWARGWVVLGDTPQ